MTHWNSSKDKSGTLIERPYNYTKAFGQQNKDHKRPPGDGIIARRGTIIGGFKGVDQNNEVRLDPIIQFELIGTVQQFNYSTTH
ncbi:unnamed protein product [Brugia timori]|uniref:Jacalin-type lectin domain-containing protein n=1 Tax=Brugia timori TaxID=42155 RepID=A0A0R3Q9F6_9BILA|nr:unnamed protein product [Brugia timori]